MVLGGKAGLRDTLVGETTRHVVNKAPCRVILTAAPPSEPPRDVAEPPVDLAAPPPTGDPALHDHLDVAEAAGEPAR
jgi:hypothetical protein